MKSSQVAFSLQRWNEIFRSFPWIVICLVALLGAAGCGPELVKPEVASKTDLETIEADLLMLEPQLWISLVRCQGSLFGDEQSVVGARVAGRVAQVHVDLGEFVKTGDPLVTLDVEEFQLQVTQAEAQLRQARAVVGLDDDERVEELAPENSPVVREQMAVWKDAQSTLQRAQELRRNNAISQGDVDQAIAAERVAEARYSGALNSVLEKLAMIDVREAELALARERLQEGTIRSPMDAYIQQRQVAPGTYLAVGQPIAVLVRTHPLRFVSSVSEKYAQALVVGQEVHLQIESVDEPYVTHISRVSPMLDQRSRSLGFEADIPNIDNRLRAGLFAEAKIVIDPQARALVVPNSAVVEFAGTQKVWKVIDGVAQEQEVLLGTRREEGRAVLEGLGAGDTILRDASQGRIAKIVAPSSSAEADPTSQAAPSDQES